jgi:hypothetical protein
MMAKCELIEAFRSFRKLFSFSGISPLVIILCSLGNFSNSIYAQKDSLWNEKPTLTVSGFADVYYVYDFAQPQGIQRQEFLYNHNRHNEFNLNLSILKLNLKHSKYRANLALQSGTYVADNYADEPALFRSLFEANIGISLNKKNNLWLDAGIFPSHIGFESALSIDNWTLTRSILAENSPYFETGAKITYQASKKWEISGLLLNGWQNIQRVQGNSMLSIGSQLRYTINENLFFNWSTFIGTDYPDDLRKMRYFNNFYGQIQFNRRLGLILGFDIGSEQISKGSNDMNYWYSPVLIGRFTISDNLNSAIRIEHYRDMMGVMIPKGIDNTFNVSGLSINIDYTPLKAIVCRIEGRLLSNQDPIFQSKTIPTSTNFSVAASIAIAFSEILR